MSNSYSTINCLLLSKNYSWRVVIKLNKKHSESNICTFYRTENITDEKREWGLCSRIQFLNLQCRNLLWSGHYLLKGEVEFWKSPLTITNDILGFPPPQTFALKLWPLPYMYTICWLWGVITGTDVVMCCCHLIARQTTTFGNNPKRPMFNFCLRHP